MPSFLIRVPDGDEGEDLGEYESDYLPRVGEKFTLWHPRVCKAHDPFCGVVTAVDHEAFHASHPLRTKDRRSFALATVWLAEEYAPPTLYCDCSEEDRTRHAVEDGHCSCCSGARSA